MKIKLLIISLFFSGICFGQNLTNISGTSANTNLRSMFTILSDSGFIFGKDNDSLSRYSGTEGYMRYFNSTHSLWYRNNNAWVQLALAGSGAIYTGQYPIIVNSGTHVISADTGYGKVQLITGGWLYKVADSLATATATGYVPYVGATGNVVTTHNIIANDFVGTFADISTSVTVGNDNSAMSILPDGRIISSGFTATGDIKFQRAGVYDYFVLSGSNGGATFNYGLNLPGIPVGNATDSILTINASTGVVGYLNGSSFNYWIKNFNAFNTCFN